MEEYSELEHVTGSPTAGESGFVHVEPIDSSSMDGSAINQDDGVVVTKLQDESNDLRVTDDGGNEEFVDCPDDLISYESQESEVVSEDQQIFGSEREILPPHYQEERQQLVTELTNLRHQLKLLIKKHPLIDGKDSALFTYELAKATVVGDDKSLWPLHEMIFDCSRFLELALSEQSQTEHTVKELYTTLDLKDKEINDLNVKIFEHSSVETTTDRILSSLTNALGLEEFHDTSVNGKMLNLEKVTSFLIQKHSHFLSEVEMLKRKELELTHKSNHLEDEYRKLVEQLYKGKEMIKMLNSEIGRLKGEVEVEKTRYINTREKLNLAVTKGKSLVQQRDSLKQVVSEKTSELDKCLIELNEKSSALENMVQIETLANSLKDQSFKLQDEINRIKEAARVKIDCLTVSLLIEGLDKNYLEEEFTDLTHKNVCLKADLQRSEDKSVLLREKLSMAVKKGKSLVQEREIMKQQIAEKNTHIEGLNLELKQQEDQISKLSSDLEQITKLEFDLLHLKEERDQIEKFLVESNNMLQKVIDATDEIVLPVNITEPVEKVKWCASYSKECQVSKEKLEQDLRDVKDEASTVASKLSESLETMKSLEDTLSFSEKKVSQLIEEKRELENIKTHMEEEVKESCRTIKSLEDTVSQLQTHVSQFSNENDRNLFESEIKKLKDEASYHEHKLMETIKTLEDALLKANNTVSNLVGEKKNLEQEISKLLENLLTDEFIRFSKFIDELTTSLLLKLEAIKNTMPITLEHTKTLQKSVDVLQIDKQEQEKHMSLMSTEIKELQAELQKTKSMFDKVKEQNDMFQNRVLKMETELEASQTMRDEMGIKLQDYQAKEDEWNRREAELSKQLIKNHEAENERDMTESSEISEVEDPVSIGKRTMPLVRTFRKGSNDHLALNIDSEADRLINNLEDKGHVFKSLHTSGLVPPQGKIIADRLDGIWVSSGGALMSRPRARLGVIAYWLVLHLWLVSTLL